MKDPDRDSQIEKVLRRLRESEIPQEMREARSAVPCPSSELLERFRREDLPPAEAEELSFHLLGCADCAAEVLARERVESAEEMGGDSGAESRIMVLQRRRVLLAAAAAIILVGVLVTLLFGPRGALVLDVSLRGDRGLVREGENVLAAGENFQVQVSLRRPACIVVFHEDTAGTLSEVFPDLEPAPLLDGPSEKLLPGETDAWDSVDLERGAHALWIVAAPSSLSRAERESLAASLRAALRGVSPRTGGRADLLPDVRQALEPRTIQVIELPFRVD